MTEVLKQTGRKLSYKNSDLYLLACIDFVLVFGIIVGKSQFLYGFFVVALLIFSMALLLTILVTGQIFKKSAKLQKNKRVVIMSIILKGLLLITLPKLLPLVISFQFLQIFFAVALQSFSAYLFTKEFQGELRPLFAFVDQGISALSQSAFALASQLFAKASKSKTASNY